MGIYILRPISCAIGAPAYNTLSKNTTTKSIAKLGNKVRQPSRPAALGRAGTLLERVCALRNQRESGRGCPRRTLHILDESAEAIAFGITDANRSVEDLLRDLHHAVEQRAATRQDDATRQLSVPTRISNLVRHVHQNFFRAWLQNVAENLPRQLPRRATSDRGNFDHLAALVVIERSTRCATDGAFYFLRFRNRRT